MPIDGKKVEVSSASVQRIWSARELKPHLVKTFTLSNDRAEVAPARDRALVRDSKDRTSPALSVSTTA